ncbi:MAG: MATE family efflux transporter [Roseburia inulinivorans]
MVFIQVTEGFAFLPITCFAMSLTTFIGQNLGAKQYDRAKKGAYFGITCSTLLAEVVGVIAFLRSRSLQRHLTMKRRLLNSATRQAHIEAFFYCFLAFSHCIAGIMRGAGKSTSANVCHACILVHHKNCIHHGYRAFYPENPGHLLGVPADLVNQFSHLFNLLLKSELAI